MPRYHTKRLVTQKGNHMGFVVADESAELVITTDCNHRPYSPLAAFAFAKVNEAIQCNFSLAMGTALEYRTDYIAKSYAECGIGDKYRLEDF